MELGVGLDSYAGFARRFAFCLDVPFRPLLSGRGRDVGPASSAVLCPHSRRVPRLGAAGRTGHRRRTRGAAIPARRADHLRRADVGPSAWSAPEAEARRAVGGAFQRSVAGQCVPPPQRPVEPGQPAARAQRDRGSGPADLHLGGDARPGDAQVSAVVAEQGRQSCRTASIRRSIRRGRPMPAGRCCGISAISTAIDRRCRCFAPCAPFLRKNPRCSQASGSNWSDRCRSACASMRRCARCRPGWCG